jgi:hypothetical protein
MEAILSMLKESLESGRGVTLYFGCHRLAMVVRKIEGTAYVEGTSQEFGRIVVRLDSVTGAAA